jgi:hypothetical protein
MTGPEFKAALKSQSMPTREDIALVCPVCGYVQSPRDLIEAGAGEDFDAVAKYVGFNCVGRFTGAGSPRKEPDGQPCNWTLGGFLIAHKLEVIDEEGRAHPIFEPATPEQARAHLAARGDA